MNASAKNVRKEKRKIVDPKNGTDPIEAAEEAGLSYVATLNPVTRARRTGRPSNISIRIENRFVTNKGSHALGGWPFLRLGVRSGFAGHQMDTSKPPGAMPVGANNIVIMIVGARCATRTNMSDWLVLEKRCRKLNNA